MRHKKDGLYPHVVYMDVYRPVSGADIDQTRHILIYKDDPRQAAIRFVTSQTHNASNFVVMVIHEHDVISALEWEEGCVLYM